MGFSGAGLTAYRARTQQMIMRGFAQVCRNEKSFQRRKYERAFRRLECSRGDLLLDGR